MLSDILTYNEYLSQEELTQRRRGEENERGTSLFYLLVLFFLFSLFLLPLVLISILVYQEINGSSRYFLILAVFVLWSALFLFYWRLKDYILLYQSREYLDKRSYNYKYKTKYYLRTIVILSLYSIPIVLIATVGYEGIPEVNSTFSNDLGNYNLEELQWYYVLAWLLLTFFFYVRFVFYRELLSSTEGRKFGGHMQTDFSGDGIVIAGKYSDQSYNFSFALDEIQSFVALLLRKEAFSQLPYEHPIGRRAIIEAIEFKDTLVIYLENRQGYLHNISYFIQEEELQESTLRTLKEKYRIPVTHIQVQSLQELRNAGIMTIGFYQSYFDPFRTKSGKFISIRRCVSLRTSLFFSEFIRKGEKKEQVINGIEPVEGTNTERENSIISLRESNMNIREKLSSPYWYGLNDTFVWLGVAGVAIVNGWLTHSLAIFFLTYILGAPCYIIPTRKWYHLGIDKLPVCFALLCTLFYLL